MHIGFLHKKSHNTLRKLTKHQPSATAECIFYKKCKIISTLRTTSIDTHRRIQISAC